MNQLNKLPLEIINKILYEHKGLEHTTSIIIKDFMHLDSNKKRCFSCHKERISLSYCDINYYSNIPTIKSMILYKNNIKKIWLCFCCAH